MVGSMIEMDVPAFLPIMPPVDPRNLHDRQDLQEELEWRDPQGELEKLDLRDPHDPYRGLNIQMSNISNNKVDSTKLVKHKL